MDQDVLTVEDLTAEEAQVILFKTDRQRQADDGPRSPAASSHRPASGRGDRAAGGRVLWQLLLDHRSLSGFDR